MLNGRENNQKLINFEEFREILPDFASKMNYFNPKTTKSAQKVNFMKNDIFDDFGVISKLMKNDSFLHFINHFSSKYEFFNDILSFYSIIESIKCHEE